jgi:methionine sulfoxide reductase heme-binding subunit
LILATFTADWYAARAAGIVAYLLLSSSLALGLLLAGKERIERWPRFAIEDVHRFAGLLAGSLIGLHVVTIVIDSQAHVSLASAIVPFTADYRPLWTGLGTVAAELLLVLAVTNHYRKRLPYVFWRRLHYLNFGVWLAATAHGLGAGSDSGSPWFIGLYVGSTAFLVLLAIGRFSRPEKPKARAAPPQDTRLESVRP